MANVAPSAPSAPSMEPGTMNDGVGEAPQRGSCVKGDLLLFTNRTGFEYDPRCLSDSEVVFIKEDFTQGGEQPAQVMFPSGVSCCVAYEDLRQLTAPAERGASWEPQLCGQGVSVVGKKVEKLSEKPYEASVALGMPMVTSESPRIAFRLHLGDHTQRSFVGFTNNHISVKGMAATLNAPVAFAIDTHDGSLYCKARGQIGEKFLDAQLQPGVILTLLADPATGVISLSVDGGEDKPVWRGIQEALPLRPYIELCNQGASASIM
eukprot:TRINITY_DN46740_c0_g1_i1.p1 TRINITY_DN46740_c0_g1~~TRINITY_DN46740_c0_g1_i1.p1  ORF type:complete len:264 (+),score=67.81 TRINITY_DN46740_c0_g1_i1:64-855(+)